MDAMTSFDAALVDLWFGRAMDSAQPLMPFWGIRPTGEESAVILAGQQELRAAIGLSQESEQESEQEPGLARDHAPAGEAT